MGYSLRKVWIMMRHNKQIYLLLILELAVGMCMYVYSCNLSVSIQKEEESLKKEESGFLLRIDTKSEQERIGQAPLSFDDYEFIQSLTGHGAELLINFPDILIRNGEIIDYNLLLLDYGNYGLKDSFIYMGEHISSVLGTGDVMPGIEQLSIKKDQIILQTGEDKSVAFETQPMPIALQNDTLRFISVDSNVSLSDCMLLSLAAMDTLQAAIQPETMNYELRIHKKEISEKGRILEEITQRLNKEHGEFYSYEFYSPADELRNNTFKTKRDISSIQKVGILLLCTVFLAAVSIFGILLERRESEMGICQVCGAGVRVIAMEIFGEILIVCLTGTVIGCGAGIFLTYNLTSFLAGGVEMTMQLSTLLRSLLICLFIVTVVFIVTIKKIYTKSIIALIRKQP